MSKKLSEESVLSAKTSAPVIDACSQTFRERLESLLSNGHGMQELASTLSVSKMLIAGWVRGTFNPTPAMEKLLNEQLKSAYPEG